MKKILHVTWLPAAEDDIKRLHNFLSDLNPIAADKAVEAIFADIYDLVDYPEIGRPYHKDHRFRELWVKFGARGYLVRYRISNDEIIISKIYHGLEDSRSR